MKYMGSKARHAKELLPIILEGRKEGQWYVEPFVGGANMIDKVDGNRIGADINEYLISLWQAVSNGWEAPSTFQESDYNKLRDNKDDYDKLLVAIQEKYGVNRVKEVRSGVYGNERGIEISTSRW